MGVLLDLSRGDTPLGLLARQGSAGKVKLQLTRGLTLDAGGFIGLGAQANIPNSPFVVGGEIFVGINLQLGGQETLNTITPPAWFPEEPTTGLGIHDIAAEIDKVTVTGVTVVTHGYQPPFAGSGDSLFPLAEAIYNNDGWLLDYDIQSKGKSGYFQIDPTADGIPDIPSKFSVGKSGQVVLLFDWNYTSNELSRGWTEAAGDALFNMLVGLHLIDPLNPASNPPLHFIGHSFGCAVTSEAVERLAYYHVPVDHVYLSRSP